MQVFVDTLIQEIALQKSYIKEPIETIYFGGGTPSLLEEAQLKEINLFDLRGILEDIREAEVV